MASVIWSIFADQPGVEHDSNVRSGATGNPSGLPVNARAMCADDAICPSTWNSFARSHFRGQPDYVIPVAKRGSNRGLILPCHFSCNQERNRTGKPKPTRHARDW